MAFSSDSAQLSLRAPFDATFCALQMHVCDISAVCLV